MFCLNDYDCIGFDLDNTLCEYHEFELVTLTYNILASFLVNKKNYNSDFLIKSIEPDLNSLRKGLTLDLIKGNVLSVAYDGFILRASHGTKMLTDSEIESIYGKNRKWILAMCHCKDLLETWNGELSEQIRSSLDYFDMSVPLLFARAVDSIDKQCKTSNYNIWPDILSGLAYMFEKNFFVTNEGDYYPSLKTNPFKYIRKCSSGLLNWLKMLKNSGKILFLITGSNIGYGNLVARYSLGEDWKKYFDVVVFYARKPGFFIKNRQFFTCLEFEPGDDPISDLKLDTDYCEGNWTDLHMLFCKKLGKTNPKCLYIGDNLIQDIYTPAMYKCCDTVAVVKELSAERKNDDEFFTSEKWGSLFYDKLHDKYTIWGHIIPNYSKICIPSVEWFSDKSIIAQFPEFQYDREKHNLSGYQTILPSCFL